jgi:hypothetical protein
VALRRRSQALQSDPSSCPLVPFVKGGKRSVNALSNFRRHAAFSRHFFSRKARVGGAKGRQQRPELMKDHRQVPKLEESETGPLKFSV